MKKYLKLFIATKICQKCFSQEASNSSGLLLSSMKGIEDVIILRLISLGKPLLPSNNARIISFSLIFRISELIALSSSKKTFRWFEKFWQRIKKWYVSSASIEQGHNGFNASWKLFLDLCSLKWLKPTRRRVNNLKPETSLLPKVLLAVGRIKYFISSLRNTEYEGSYGSFYC